MTKMKASGRTLVNCLLVLSLAASTTQISFAATPANAAAAYPLLKKAYDSMLRNQFHPAVQTLVQAVKLDPNNLTARRYLGYALLQLNAPHDAINQMVMVTRITRPTAFDLYTFGEAYLMSGDYPNAENSFKGALGLDPNFVIAKGGLIKVMSAKGEYDTAMQTCIEGVRSPNSDKRSQSYYRALYASVQDAKLSAVAAPAATETAEKPKTDEPPKQQGNNPETPTSTATTTTTTTAASAPVQPRVPQTTLQQSAHTGYTGLTGLIKKK